MGTPLRELIEVHARRHAAGLRTRAVSPGGASTAFVAAEDIDVALDFDRARQGRAAASGPGRCRPRRPDLPGRHDAQPAAVLRPGVVRLVHALPRGAAVGRGPPRGHRGGRRPPGGPRRARRARSGSWARTNLLRPRAGCVQPLESALRLFRDDFERHVDDGAAPIRTAGPGYRSCGGRLVSAAAPRASSSPSRSTGASSASRRGATCSTSRSRWASTCPSSAGIPCMGSIGACRQCAVRLRVDREGTRRSEIVMACMTEAAGRHAHRHRRPRGDPVPRPDDRAHDDEPPARLPGLRRGRRVPPAGHDGDDRPQLPALPVQQAHLPQPGPRAVRGPRDEPLHHLLPLRALLQRLRRRPTTSASSASATRSTSGARPTAPSRASSAATWSRSAPPASSPTRPSEQHYTRKWDLQTAPSVCPHCGLGCNTTPGERYGELRRVLSRYNRDVNETSSATAAASATRSSTRPSGSARRVSRGGRRPSGAASAMRARPPREGERALDAAAALLCDRRVIGIGSPRASLEANYALRALVGAERFYLGMSAVDRDLVGTVLEIARDGRLRLGSLSDVHGADAVVVLGEDLTNTAPMLDLTLRTWLRFRPTAEEERLHIRRWNDAAIGRAKRRTSSALWRPRRTRPSSTRSPPRVARRARRHRPARPRARPRARRGAPGRPRPGRR